MIEKLPLDLVSSDPSVPAKSGDMVNVALNLSLKINEVIEAVNAITTPDPVVHVPYTMATSLPGFRPLHIEDGQVVASNLYEAPVLHEDAKSGKYVSVPEAEPQEQELPTFEEALDAFKWAAVRQGSFSTEDPAWRQAAWECEDAERVVIDAAHREYDQPVGFSQEDVDLLKALPDSGDWQTAEGYGSINNGPWFRSLIERIQVCVPAAQSGKGV